MWVWGAEWGVGGRWVGWGSTMEQRRRCSAQPAGLAWLAKADVLGDGGGKQRGFLAHEAQLGPQEAQLQGVRAVGRAIRCAPAELPGQSAFQLPGCNLCASKALLPSSVAVVCPANLQPSNVHSIDQHPPSQRVVEALNQADHSALAAAALTHECHRLRVHKGKPGRKSRLWLGAHTQSRAGAKPEPHMPIAVLQTGTPRVLPPSPPGRSAL